MKRIILLMMASMLAVCSITAQLIIRPNCQAYERNTNGRDYVDLGLPSGLKWATRNVGAANPWNYGAHFAWGETKTKAIYDWATYIWCRGASNTLTKYNHDSNAGKVDNKYTLDIANDAAHVSMGGSWRMPTREEMLELKDNCYLELTDNYNGKGVAGCIVYKVKNASDKAKIKFEGKIYYYNEHNNRVETTISASYSLSDTHIFLPSAGFYDNRGLQGPGECGYYWSSSLSRAGGNSNSAITFVFFTENDNGTVRVDEGLLRDDGYSVRGVCE